MLSKSVTLSASLLKRAQSTQKTLPTFFVVLPRQQRRQMSAFSHFQTLVKSHKNIKHNYSLAFKELDNLVKNNELHKNSVESTADTTDIRTLFDTVHACLVARSKLEDHNYLPILKEDVNMSDLLDNGQKKLVHSFKKDHVTEHQALNHTKKLIDTLYSHHKSQQAEALKNIGPEFETAHRRLDLLLQKEEDNILYPLMDTMLGEDGRREVLESVRNHQRANNVIEIANNLAEATLSDILRVKELYPEVKGDVADSILKEFSKSVPHHIWMNISFKNDQVPDVVL